MIGGLGAKDILIQLKGDNKDLKNAMADSDKSMGNLTSSVKKYGPAMAAAFAVGTAAFVGMSVKMAAAEEVVNRQTESMLKSQGIMWDEVKGEVTDYINELEKLTAYGDTDLQMAFNRMSSSGMGYASTMEYMKMVTDIAYTRNIDLVAAADLVAKAYNGQGSALKRYGIILEEGLTGMEAVAAMQLEVNKNFADAADRTDTLEGSMDLLTTQTDDFKEALGAELLDPLSAFVGLLSDGGEGAESFGTKLGKGLVFPWTAAFDVGEKLDKINTASKELFALNKRGVDTEKEIVNWYSLRSDKLTDMTDEYFEHAILVLRQAGYADRADKLERSRAYGINMQNRAKQEQLILDAQLLAIEEALTAEGEKQLLSMRERARLARAAIQSIPGVEGKGGIGGFAGVSSDELRGLRQTEDVKVGYKRPSGQWTILRPVQSGAP